MPAFYNPNISLISKYKHSWLSIGKTKQLSQLLSLHKNLGKDFTPKHLAQAARKMYQLIKEHKSHSKYGVMLDGEHELQFKVFLKNCS